MIETPCINVLTIAGADSGGASGIQADLRTFAAFGAHGLSAISAATAQNMDDVVAVQPVPARWIERQLQAVFAGYRVRAVKIGMLGNAANVIAVAAALRAVRARNIVLDPVLASSSGTPLLSARGVRVLREQLIPLADLVTPNLPEAAILLGARVRETQALRAARAVRALGARAVLLKGGHGRGRVVRDILVAADGEHEYRHPRLALHARGTGCVLSAAVACGLAKGQDLPAAVAAAENFLQTALRASYRPARSVRRVLEVFAKH